MESKLGNLEPIRDLVYRHLREQILTGALNHGMRLKEVAISEELGVSRTPIREAIRKLESEGLVQYASRRGVTVTALDAGEMKEIYELREVLEGLTSRLAAERGTDEEIRQLQDLALKMERAYQTRKIGQVPSLHTKFNELLYSMSRNKKLFETLARYNEYIEKSQFISMQREGRAQRIMSEHSAIVDAIRRRSPQQAEEAARQHVSNASKAYFKEASQ